MLWIATILLAGALALLVASIRGRVIARGRFCRKCRFDLAGLDGAPACPECGGDITRPSATRPWLRRSSRPGIVLGVVLLLTGLTLAGIAASNNTARVFAALPDRVVLALHALHADAAFTEITTNRLVRTKPLSEAAWGRLIDKAMEHQADITTPWDPRHGEVLANALITGRLTDAQIAQYVRLGMDSRVDFPESIRIGTKSAGIMVLRSNSKRVASLNRVNSATDGHDRLKVQIQVQAVGVLQPKFEHRVNRDSVGNFDIPSGGGFSSTGIGDQILLDGFDWASIELPGEITLFATYELSVCRWTGDEKFYAAWTQTATGTVRVEPSDAAIVRLNADPATIETFRTEAFARLRQLYIPKPVERGQFERSINLAQSDFIVSGTPVAIAGDVYVIHGATETRIASVSSPATQGIAMRTILWSVEEGEEVDEELLASWLAAGSVTIEIRPNPEVAESTHDIREILAVPLRFEGVPLTDERPANASYSIMPRPNETIGRPVEPSPEPDD